MVTQAHVHAYWLLCIYLIDMFKLGGGRQLAGSALILIGVPLNVNIGRTHFVTIIIRGRAQGRLDVSD